MSILSERDLKVRCKYSHVSGLCYLLDGFVFDVTSHEKTNDLRKMVIYTQLEDGKGSKAGTQFVRDVEDFLRYFSSTTSVEFSEDLDEGFLEKLKVELGRVFEGSKRIGIKVHFGEPGNETSLTPEKIAPFVGVLKDLGFEVFLYDSLVAYDSIRADAIKHREHAVAKGYGELGEVRTNDDFVLKKGRFMDYEVSSDLVEADGVFVISHVKGHPCSGFGGAIKNLGMGAVTKKSKGAIHNGGHYEFNKSLCVKCGLCVEKCPLDFVKMREDGPTFNDCYGCSNCCVYCPTGALKPKVEVFDKLLADCALTAERSFAKVFYVNIIKDISRLCDCESHGGGIIAKDVGFVFGNGAGEVDRESYERIMKREGDVFLRENKKRGDAQILEFESLNKDK